MEIDTPSRQSSRVTVKLTNETGEDDADNSTLYDDGMLIEEIVTIVNEDTEMGSTPTQPLSNVDT
jgi:hypothetical protein